MILSLLQPWYTIPEGLKDSAFFIVRLPKLNSPFRKFYFTVQALIINQEGFSFLDEPLQIETPSERTEAPETLLYIVRNG